MSPEFGFIFWPVFAAFMASNICLELFNFGLGMWITWKQNKRIQAAKEKIAAQMGIDPSQLDFTMDSNGNNQFGNTFNGIGPGYFPPAVSGASDGHEHGHGQYL